jgi:hypothetical protein
LTPRAGAAEAAGGVFTGRMDDADTDTAGGGGGGGGGGGAGGGGRGGGGVKKKRRKEEQPATEEETSGEYVAGLAWDTVAGTYQFKDGDGSLPRLLAPLAEAGDGLSLQAAKSAVLQVFARYADLRPGGGGGGGGAGGGGGGAGGGSLEQQGTTRRHLQHRLDCALVLKLPDEYLAWLRMLARFLAAEVNVACLRALCDGFLGPPSAHSTEPPPPPPPGAGPGCWSWQPCVLGMPKRTLLRQEVLPAMGTNRALQRMVTEYDATLADIREQEQPPVE